MARLSYWLLLRWLLLIYDDIQRGLLAVASLIDVDIQQFPARPCRSCFVWLLTWLGYGRYVFANRCRYTAITGTVVQ